jgi:hypothetical protein
MGDIHASFFLLFVAFLYVSLHPFPGDVLVNINFLLWLALDSVLDRVESLRVPPAGHELSLKTISVVWAYPSV